MDSITTTKRRGRPCLPHFTCEKCKKRTTTYTKTKISLWKQPKSTGQQGGFCPNDDAGIWGAANEKNCWKMNLLPFSQGYVVHVPLICYNIRKQRKTRYSQKQKKNTHPSCTRQECDRSVNGSQGGRGRRGDDVEGRQTGRGRGGGDTERRGSKSGVEREREAEA